MSLKDGGTPKSQKDVEGQLIVNEFFRHKVLKQFICKWCSSASAEICISQDILKGRTNLIRHVNDKHSEAKQALLDAHRQSASTGTALTKFFKPAVTEYAKTLYIWLMTVIMNDFPLTYVQNSYVRMCTKLKCISTYTLNKFLKLVEEKITAKLTKLLPDSFGIVFDGWSSARRDHYVALFATYSFSDESRCETVKTHLLAFQPLLDETSLNAVNHASLIKATCEMFGKDPATCIEFLTGDNCTTNCSIADRLNVGFVGCASHRLNLAVNEFLKHPPYEECITSVHALMLSLNTIKNRAALRAAGTNLSPMFHNQTRWWSKYLMLQRYVQLHPFLLVAHIDTATINLIPFPTIDKRIRTLNEKLEPFQVVTDSLQKHKEVVTLATVRAIFDKILIKDVDENHLFWIATPMPFFNNLISGKKRVDSAILSLTIFP